MSAKRTMDTEAGKSMGINYDYYRIFYYVARYQSFTQAANALMYNQPNITRTIKNLENELGCTLFVRSNRGVTLTPEGEKLYAHVRAGVEQIQAGEEELLMDRSLSGGVISISVSEVALRCLFLSVMKQYQSLSPGVRLKMFSHSTPQAVETVRNGLVDMALVTAPTGNLYGMKAVKVKDIQEVPVCGAAFEKLSKRQITLEEVSKYPLICLGSQTNTYGFYSSWFLEQGLAFKPDIEASAASQILPMVRNNLGIGFVPEEFLAGEEANQVIPLRLKDPVPPRSLCLIKRPGQTLGIAARKLEGMILRQKQEGGEGVKS